MASAVSPLTLLIALEKQRTEIKLCEDTDFNSIIKILAEARKIQKFMEST